MSTPAEFEDIQKAFQVHKASTFASSETGIEAEADSSSATDSAASASVAMPAAKSASHADLIAPLFAHQLFGHEEAVIGFSRVKILVCFALPSMRCFVQPVTWTPALSGDICDDFARRLAPAQHPGAVTTDAAVFRDHLAQAAAISATASLPAPLDPDDVFDGAVAAAKAAAAAAAGGDDDDDDDNDSDAEEGADDEPELPPPTSQPFTALNQADAPSMHGVRLARFTAEDGSDCEVRAWALDTPRAAEFHRRMEMLCMWQIESADAIKMFGATWTAVAVFCLATAHAPARLAAYGTLTRFLNPFRKGRGLVLRLCQALTVPCFQRRGLASALYAACHGLAAAAGAGSLTIEGASDSLRVVRDQVEAALTLHCGVLSEALPRAHEAWGVAVAAGERCARIQGVFQGVLDAATPAVLTSIGGAVGAFPPYCGGEVGHTLGVVLPAATTPAPTSVAAVVAAAAPVAPPASRIAVGSSAIADGLKTGHPSPAAVAAVEASCRVAGFMSWRLVELATLLDGMHRGEAAAPSGWEPSGLPAEAWMGGYRRAVKRRLLAQMHGGQVKFEDSHARWAYLELRFVRELLAYLRTLQALRLVETAAAISETELALTAAQTVFDTEAARARERAQAARTRKLLQQVAAGEIDVEGDPEMAAMVQMVQAAARSGGMPAVFGSE